MDKTICQTSTSGVRGLKQVVALALVEEEPVLGNRPEYEPAPTQQQLLTGVQQLALVEFLQITSPKMEF